MSELRLVLASAVVSAAVVGAAVATASGPPPPEPVPPELRTVVGHGTAAVDVAKPRARTNESIAVVVKAAKEQALPQAVNAARADAIRVSRAAGLTLGKPMGAEREVSPYGYGGDESDGTWGPNQWCRTWRGKYRCHIPRHATVRVTLTVAAS
jgi:hypothetical protein